MLILLLSLIFSVNIFSCELKTKSEYKILKSVDLIPIEIIPFFKKEDCDCCVSFGKMKMKDNYIEGPHYQISVSKYNLTLDLIIKEFTEEFCRGGKFLLDIDNNLTIEENLRTKIALKRDHVFADLPRKIYIIFDWQNEE